MSIAAVLGGEKQLGQKAKSRIDFDALIKKGLPLGVISHIKKVFDLPDEVIARIIGVSPRTVSRRRKTVPIPAGERLSSVESDRVYRFARIVATAEEIFGDKKEAMEWLNSPQHGLGGHVPFGMLQTDAGAHEVEELLTRIDYGTVS